MQIVWRKEIEGQIFCAFFWANINVVFKKVGYLSCRLLLEDLQL
jgi:hypothetical protein